MTPSHDLTPFYGLPSEIAYCKRCVMSNQRPSSYPEFRHTKNRVTPTIHFDDEGVCDACRFAEMKDRTIDWEAREQELLRLLDQHRSTDGSYDCVVPGSGGKDSIYAAWLLKYKYGMHPLTVTWPPVMYTDIGWQNFNAWIYEGGFPNVMFHPDGKVHRLLTRLAIENLLHPFQTFILGQKNLAPKLALKYGIKLIFFGENEAEYGNPIADNESSLRSHAFYAADHLDDIYLGGVNIRELQEKHGLTLGDLEPYLPAPERDVANSGIEVHYMGYYTKWVPQEAYYQAVQHSGFQPNPVRSEGTYSKYVSLDDKIDGLHYYTTYIKFGIGRTTYEASQEIRNKHLTREEAIALVKRFDGEFPERYAKEVLEFVGISLERFEQLVNEARSPHLWDFDSGVWKLRKAVWMDE